MNTKRLIVIFSLLVSAMVLNNCGGGADGGSGSGPCIGCTGPVVGNPGFTFVFEGFDNFGFKVAISFIPDDASDGLNQGNFDSSSSIEYYSIRNTSIESIGFSGTFDGIDMEFTRKEGNGSQPELATTVEYIGRFLNDNQILITQADDPTIQFELRRNDQPFIPEFADNWSGSDAAGNPNVFQFGWAQGFDNEDNTGRIVATRIVNNVATTFVGTYSVNVITLTSIEGTETLSGTIEQAGDLLSFRNGLQLNRTTTEGEGRVFFTANRFDSKIFTADLFGTNIRQIVTDTEIETKDLKLSPDGNKIAFRANSSSGQPFQLYVADVTSIESPIITQVSQTFAGRQSVANYEWWENSNGITYSAGTSPNEYLLYSVQAPTWNVRQLSVFNLSTSSSFWISPTTNQVAYLINFGAGNMSLRMIESDDIVTRSLIQENSDFKNINWDQNGRMLAYLEGSLSAPASFDLWTFTLSTLTNTKISDNRGIGTGVRNYQFSNDGQWLAYVSNLRAPTSFDLKVAESPLGSSGQPQRILNTNLASVGIPTFTGFSWSPNSTHIVFVEPNELDLSLTDIRLATVNPADPLLTLATTATSSEQIFADQIVWGQNGDTVVYRIGEFDSASLRYVAYNVATGGPTTTITNNMLTQDNVGTLERPFVSPDGSQIAYLADTLVAPNSFNRSTSVYVAQIDGSSNRRATSTFDSSVPINSIQWVDDNRFLFEGNLIESTSDELFLGYVQGDGVVKISDIIGNGRGVTNYVLKP